MTARIMALDYGSKRIGVALSDPMQIFAKAYGVIPNTGFEHVLAKVQEIIREQAVGAVVIGMPYAIDGTNTPKTLETMDFLDSLKNKLHLPVVSWDERYSSAEAETELKRMGKSWQDARKMVDAMAAAMILKSYLENRS